MPDDLQTAAATLLIRLPVRCFAAPDTPLDKHCNLWIELIFSKHGVRYVFRPNGFLTNDDQTQESNKSIEDVERTLPDT